MKRIHAIAGCLVLAFAASCATTEDLERLQGRVLVLEKEKAQIQEDQKRDLERMERLHKDLNEATEALRKGGANLSADLDAMKGEFPKLKGADEELGYAITKLQEDVERIKKALDEKLGIALVQLPKGLPEDANSLYKAGRDALAGGDTATARGVLRKFLDTFPDDPRAPDAQLAVGETYFKEGKYGQAIREFQRVYDKYRDVKDAPVPKALMRIADSLLKENDCKKAGGILKFVTEYDRKAPEADKAKDQLKALKKTCKGL
jgi:TolA-binding protein